MLNKGDEMPRIAKEEKNLPKSGNGDIRIYGCGVMATIVICFRSGP